MLGAENLKKWLLLGDLFIVASLQVAHVLVLCAASSAGD
jgi:hypothetical protein